MYPPIEASYDYNESWYIAYSRDPSETEEEVMEHTGLAFRLAPTKLDQDMNGDAAMEM